MNGITSLTQHCLGAQNREVLGEEPKPPKFALASKRSRAIDLSCRACDASGAMAMGAGLGFPAGDLILRFPPPTSDNDDCKLKDTILCCPVIWRDVM